MSDSSDMESGVTEDDVAIPWDGGYVAAEDALAPRDSVASDTCAPTPERCNGVDDDCDGRVDETPEADSSCLFPHAAGACFGGRCTLTRCDADRGDCDGDFANGCETALRIDVDHCGACGRRCGGFDACVGATCGSMIDVDVGTDHACAVHETGRVVCWGRNRWGQLGDGTLGDRARPVEVAGLPLSVVVRAGDRYSCALSRDRMHVHCWGKRHLGDQPIDADVMLVPEEFTATLTPRLLPAPRAIAALYAGGHNLIASFGFLPDMDTQVFAYASTNWDWPNARSISGAHPVSWATFENLTPWRAELRTSPLRPGVPVSYHTDVNAISCSLALSAGNPIWLECQRMALSDDNHAEVTWDLDPSRRVATIFRRRANGVLEESFYGPSPLTVDGRMLNIPIVDRLAGGEQSLCALLQGAPAWACVRFPIEMDRFSRLVTTTSLTTRPYLPRDLQRLRLFHHGVGGCFLSGGGRVLCWGQNHYGRLGDGTMTDRPEPVVVLGR